MAKLKKTRYADYYLLMAIIQAQQSLPKKYDPRNYFGYNMRLQEKQTASFLSDFINGTIVILPEHYNLLGNIMFVLRSSRYKPIKKLLPQAIIKYNSMMSVLRERQNAADSVKPELSDGVNKYSILENKKKMLMMSCSDICALGDALNAEKNFNTSKIKNKFFAFVTYRIELVLTGKMPIDPDFNLLLKKYGTSHQINTYNKIITNQLASYTPVQIQPVNTTQPKVQVKQQPKPQVKQKTQSVIRPVSSQKKQPSQPKQKKSGTGFFKKIRQSAKNVFESAKNVFNKVKKPLLIGGLFALSIFGGKRAYDTAIEQNTATTQTETYTTKSTDVQKNQTINISDSLRTNNTKPAVNNHVTATPTNDVMKKTVAKLQNLKATNPSDRNMDVNQTANRLYRKFGNDAYKVVLASAMTPYALNEYTKFDFRPSTHNMIEYLCTHELTTAQRSALNKFIATHVKNNSINMNNFAAYNINRLMQNQR